MKREEIKEQIQTWLLEESESQKCHIRYGRNNLEIRMWIFSLIYMSWTLMNLTNKVKEGHCRNIDH